MNSIIAIGDVHGLTYWKTIVEKKTKSRIVFLGDYLDPYESFSIDQLLENLLDIIILKKQSLLKCNIISLCKKMVGPLMI